MTDTSAMTNEGQPTSIQSRVWQGVDYYDDEDEADYDDFDDNDKPASVSREFWLSRPDFGSPEWWSRT